MAGTQLQEIGHDAVIVAFIQEVLGKAYPGSICLVNPAVGPKRDIYFPNANATKYLSACALAGQHYVPAFCYRFHIPPEDLSHLEASSEFRRQDWYAEVSRLIGHDVYSHISDLCDRLERSLNSDLPDILAIDNRGALVALAEVKFEGFSSKARDSVLREHRAARNAGVPYFLAVPRYPSYSRELSDASIMRNLPEDMIVYKFEFPKGTVLPRQEQIRFVRLNRDESACGTMAAGFSGS